MSEWRVPAPRQMRPIVCLDGEMAIKASATRAALAGFIMTFDARRLMFGRPNEPSAAAQNPTLRRKRPSVTRACYGNERR